MRVIINNLSAAEVTGIRPSSVCNQVRNLLIIIGKMGSAMKVIG